MSHTLCANDEHDKRQWVTNIRQVLPEGHENCANSRTLSSLREIPDGFNTSDLSMDGGTSFSSSSGVKRSGSSVSDSAATLSLASGASASSTAVKRSCSSVSDHQVSYRSEYSLLRCSATADLQLDSPLDNNSSSCSSSSATRSSRRRRSATATISSNPDTTGAAGNSCSDVIGEEKEERGCADGSETKS